MKRLLFSLYGFAFFNKFLLLTPVYAIFMQANGLSDLQLSTMFIISAFGTILGQFPITYITNRIGQRWSMIIGQVLKATAILLWLVFPNYAGFVVGMFLWGVQAGFRSVAFEGLVYDSVAAYGLRREYSRILGRKSTYESIGTALSAFGSLLMFMGYDWVTWASVMAILISIICLMMVPYRPSRIGTKASKSIPMRELFRTGLRICLRTPCLLSVMILTLLVVNIPFLDDFLSPIGLQIGIPTEYVGIVPLFLLGCATLGQRFAYKFANVSDVLLYSLIGVVGILFVLFGHSYNISALWTMGIAYMLFYGIYTLLYSRFQHMVPTRHRSVILSLYTTFNYILYMMVCGVIGLGATLGSWRFSIMILGGLMFIVCAWALFVVRHSCTFNTFRSRQ
ncbi:MAG: MFS transporter [Alphaproteobacteria bacterium]|nr:MFS transporter [Alphaproteobacteria bacterium]